MSNTICVNIVSKEHNGTIKVKIVPCEDNKDKQSDKPIKIGYDIRREDPNVRWY